MVAVPSALAVTNFLPSGLYFTRIVADRPGLRNGPAATPPLETFQRIVAPSSPHESSRRESGLHATQLTPRVCLFSSPATPPPGTLKMRTILSSHAVASHRPLGLTAAAFTSPPWAIGPVMERPVAASHTTAVPSLDAVTM